jgi:hypothetical protein
MGIVKDFLLGKAKKEPPSADVTGPITSTPKPVYRPEEAVGQAGDPQRLPAFTPDFVALQALQNYPKDAGVTQAGGTGPDPQYPMEAWDFYAKYFHVEGPTAETYNRHFGKDRQSYYQQYPDVDPRWTAIDSEYKFGGTAVPVGYEYEREWNIAARLDGNRMVPSVQVPDIGMHGDVGLVNRAQSTMFVVAAPWASGNLLTTPSVGTGSSPGTPSTPKNVTVVQDDLPRFLSSFGIG